MRVLLAGICNTDLELVRGYYPFTGVPGHEFVGVVEECASAPAWIGRRVVGEINVGCGRCPDCASGGRNHCPERTVLGIRGRPGAFAEQLLLPAANLHLVPPTLSDEAAVFTEPVAAAFQVQEQAAIGPGTRALVVGDGKLGQLVARTLALTGCDLRVLGHHRSKLDRLTDLGIATGGPEDAPAALADVVVECTGQPDGLALARQAVRPRGTIVLKSTYAGRAPMNLSRLVVDEITLVGSRCGPFPRALQALSAGLVRVADLVTAQLPLVEVVEAFGRARRPGALKILVQP